MESPKLKKGDKIMLLYMEDNDPVQPLTIGEVIDHTKVFGDDQYNVNWEGGRKLAIISGVDRWETEESLMEKGNDKLLRLFRKKIQKKLD